MTHVHSELALPSAGIVAISGLNGEGKSTLLESMSFVWARTLRGTPPWRAGQAGCIEVETEGFVVQRRATPKGGGGLRWKMQGEEDWKKFDTSAKANAELMKVLPMSYDQWRRSHVFSGADSLQFSRLGDVERKRLLDGFLGLDAVEQGIKECREEQAAKRRDVEAANLAHKLAEQTLQHWQSLPVELAPEAPVAEPEPELPEELVFDAPPTHAEICSKQEEHSQLMAEVAKVALRTREVPPDTTALVQARIEHGNAKARLAKVQGGLCGECGRTYGSADVQAAVDAERVASLRLHAENHTYEQAKRTAQEQATQARAEVAELQTKASAVLDVVMKMRELAAKEEACARDVRAWEQRAKRAQAAFEESVRKWQERSQAAGAQLRAARATEFDRACALEDAKAQLAELATADLMMAAVRATMLGGALSGLGEVANAWLEFFQSPIRVNLHVGVDSDRIGFDLTGAGGGHGYDASSSGERRRVDAAILLAMVEVVSASTGVIGGTLWFDELFDTLDSSVMAYVCQALEHLATTRCVVVITHRAELLRGLNAAARYVVQGGTVHVADREGVAA
jgi:DNA repair exonuclease SbcCD ATPase subunit